MCYMTESYTGVNSAQPEVRHSIYNECLENITMSWRKTNLVRVITICRAPFSSKYAILAIRFYRGLRGCIYAQSRPQRADHRAV